MTSQPHSAHATVCSAGPMGTFSFFPWSEQGFLHSVEFHIAGTPNAYPNFSHTTLAIVSKSLVMGMTTMFRLAS